MATDGPTPPPCDQEIYNNGECVAAAIGSSNAVENWVKAIAKEANARVDWHYVGGRVRVLHLGDNASRKRTLAALRTVNPGTVEVHQVLEQD